jgi:hypothetical protein
MNPANLPVWLAGLGWLLFSARGRPFRPLGWALSGAVDLLGPKYGLPLKALGTHQSYWLWGPGDPSKDVFILGDRPEGLRRWCGSVEAVAELSHPWTAVWENKPVLVCREPRYPLREIWPKAKNWD